MHFLWVTDAWETLDHPRDTTLRLVEESIELGHASSWCDPSGLRVESARVLARCRRVTGAPRGRGAAGWRLEEVRDLELGSFDQVHYRADPPVDRRYFEHLALLGWASGAAARPAVVNPPAVIALQGDKLGPATLARALPPTIVTSSWECLERFGRAEGRAVLKPLGGAQSRGVELLDWSSPAGAEHARRRVEELSGGFARPVLLQRFLAEVYAGEKRLWFVDGELLAAVKKRPRDGTFVVDMDKGSACDGCALSAAEHDLARAVGDAFQSHGVRLAAVDVIGHHVTDWNLTSPGMIPMMEQVLGRNLARPIVESLARAPRSP